MISKKLLLSIIFISTVLVVILVFVSSFRFVYIKSENAKNIRTYSYDDFVNKSNKPVSILRINSVNLISSGDVVIVYDGDSGYSGGYIHKNFNIYENIKIKAKEKNSQPNDSVVFSVNKVLNDLLIKNDLYKIQKGVVFNNKWYATTLLYNGDNSIYADTLRVVLEYSKGNWVLVTKKPEIIISSYKYPNIPRYVLDNVNNYQQPAIDDRYLDKTDMSQNY